MPVVVSKPFVIQQALAALQEQPEGAQSSMPSDAAGDSNDTAAAEAEGVGELETQGQEQQTKKTYIMLYGSPMAGTSAQAAMLCSRYNIPSVTVDQLLEVRM